jgi:hypothetical protein
LTLALEQHGAARASTALLRSALAVSVVNLDPVVPPCGSHDRVVGTGRLDDPRRVAIQNALVATVVARLKRAFHFALLLERASNEGGRFGPYFSVVSTIPFGLRLFAAVLEANLPMLRERNPAVQVRNTTV